MPGNRLPGNRILSRRTTRLASLSPKRLRSKMPAHRVIPRGYPPLCIEATEKCVAIEELRGYVRPGRAYQGPRLAEGEQQPAFADQRSKPPVKSASQDRPAFSDSMVDQVVKRHAFAPRQCRQLNHVYLAILTYHVDKRADHLTIVSHLRGANETHNLTRETFLQET